MATETIKPRPAASQKRQITVRGRGGSASISEPSTLTRFLGWFSIGLGATELLAPGVIARLSGTRNHRGLIRSYGLREMAAGIGILSEPQPAKWLWARVAGDALDMASIIRGSRMNHRGATVGALAAVAGVTALDIICAQACTGGEKGAAGTEHAESSLLIDKPAEECYRFWRDVENFPRFVPELRSVQATGERTSHWTARLPNQAADIAWDAEIVEDVPSERISWRSSGHTLAGMPLIINGTVVFEPAAGERGTIIRVQLDYDHAGRAATAPLTKLLGKHPEQIAQKSLRRLKQLLETGEILTTEGQPAGRRSGATWLDAIAR